jgi:prolycopene isomerase
MLSEHIKDPDLQHTLAALWGYFGLPPSKLSAFYYANATGGYLKNGSYYIKERSQDLSDAIAEAIEAHGGKLLYDTRVRKVQVDSGAVHRVVFCDGETLPARAVVSNASALATFNEMLPKEAVPDKFRKNLADYKPSLSSFIVWLGLNQDLKGKIQAFSTHISSGRGPEADYQACFRGDIENQSFSVCIYDNIFEGYSRPGTSTLQLLVRCGYEPWRKYETDYFNGNKTEYYKEKQRWTNTLIQRAEKALISGLSSMVEVEEAASPLTNRSYTGNPEGAIYGFEQSMDNAYMNRIKNTTPVKGLYLASAWGNPGGGYNGVLRGGQSAFLAMMKDWGG